ncbi:ZIP zinc transporter-domain-containing protein [Thelonectria olida]|uniref:ZIP zinc transporter-domain-containing protein n=1 Tax=Thelonectria olida TaxID=1576542 RepID=A0A9P8WIQ0_9HYPO|nr:ZIP zinc transporter-domain-containing protein [Thelonectria olida]
MICLSKADESIFRHLTWNQSPSPLAATHTTCQDLNGISNLREHVDAEQDDGSGDSSGSWSVNSDKKSHPSPQPPKPSDGFLAGAGRLLLSKESSLCPQTVIGGDDHDRPSRGTITSCLSRVWSWTAWVLSVLIVSSILSSWNSPSPVIIESAHAKRSVAPVQVSPLHKRSGSSCASNDIDKDDYNLPLHVGAVFIIFFVSGLACAFPIMASKFPGLRIPNRFFFTVRHFGTGVLIATAFVHLLPTAFLSLGDPCLGDFWTKDYPAMPGAISLAAIFFVIIIEMVFHPSRRIQPTEPVCCNGGETSETQNNGGCLGNVGMLPVRDMGPLRGRTSSIGHGLTTLNSRPEVEVREAAIQNERNLTERKRSFEETSIESSQIPALTPEQKKRKELLQCVLLELGILFHSIFIGMSLSVSIGNEFIILLIAICFHQTFEGLALGARISAVEWPQGKLQPWFMALAYGCTTPIGQAIGLATHTLYSPGSEVGLIVVGVMNAISAGLLTFASLVELLSEDFLSDESWKVLRGKKRIFACLLVFFGAFFMSLVGAWA